MHQWIESEQHWFRYWLVPYSAPSHYLNQSWFIVNWTLRNKLQWNQNAKFFINENASKHIVCETAAILSRGRWVIHMYFSGTILNMMHGNCVNGFTKTICHWVVKDWYPKKCAIGRKMCMSKMIRNTYFLQMLMVVRVTIVSIIAIIYIQISVYHTLLKYKISKKQRGTKPTLWDVSWYCALYKHRRQKERCSVLQSFNCGQGLPLMRVIS